MEQQPSRSKRAKATPVELPETSSSRGPNAELRASGNEDTPLIFPDAGQGVLQNYAPAELGSSLHNVSALISFDGETSESTAQRSPMHVLEEAFGVADGHHGTITFEEHGQPSLELGNVTDVVRLRNPHIAGTNEDIHSSQEPDMGLNAPSQGHQTAPAVASLQNHEAVIDGEVGTDTLLQRRLSIGVENERGEAPMEPVSIEEVLNDTSRSSGLGASLNITEGARLCTSEKTARSNSSPAKSPSMAEGEAHGDRADGMNCPICMEPWTGEGVHRICCLACGHLFGRSCIRRWLNQRKKNSKCPHCNRKARIEEIRDLYVPSLTVVDDKNQQLLEELGVLKSKNDELVVQNEKLKKDYRNLQAVLAVSCPQDMSRSKENFFTKRSLHPLKGCSRREAYGVDIHKSQKAITVNGNSLPRRFQLQEEFPLLGARVFDMDAYSQMLLVAQKSTAVNGAFLLKKISLLSLNDTSTMPLPPYTGAVRDIRVAPPGGKLPGRLALIASLGKMISLFSLESNNVVLTYKLQSPCWSCAWDPHEPNYVFAGLQDGVLNMLDLRQTSSPVRSLQSVCRQPVHTLHPLYECNVPQAIRRNGILSACSSGVSFWDLSTLELHNSRPHAMKCSDNGGICVALAYNHLANMGVATFRDKPSMHQSGSTTHAADVAFMEPSTISSQPPSTQLNSVAHPLRASHYPLVKSGSVSPLMSSCDDGPSVESGWRYGNPMFGNVSPVGMHRSTIICSSCIESSSDFQSVFAFGDEETRALMLWDLKTLTVLDRLKAHSAPILDVKSMNIGEQAFLGCISSTNLQVYTR